MKRNATTQRRAGTSAERRRDDGYSLVEIMASLVILTLGVASTIGVTKWMLTATYQSKMTTAATTCAQDKLEELARLKLSTLASGTDTTQAFTRAWTVTGSGNIRNVSVAVRWRGIAGTRHEVSLNSMVAN